MRSTLAFLAGLLAGFLLAWTSGPSLSRLVGQWRTGAPLEAFLGDRFAFMPPSGNRASVASTQTSFSFRLRKPVTRLVRMASSKPVSPLVLTVSREAAPAAGVDTTETVASNANASVDGAMAALAVGTASNASSVSLPEASGAAVPKPPMMDSGSGAGLSADGTANGHSRSATVSRPDSAEKDRRSPREEYDLALGSYQSGRHELARKRFAAFLQRWPEHALAPNALYWIGETWYAQGRYDQAAKFFAQVVRDYPRHAKSPDALLKLAYSAMRQGRLEQAGSYLRDLMARYPGSPASRLGRQAQSRLQGQSGAARVSLAHG